jgi:pimeloyl-ACP methyl ester carboxylesterase
MRLYEPNLSSQVIDRWWRDYDWGTRRALLRFYRSTPPFSAERIAPVLARLDRPALVVWGARNRFVPVEQAERQRKSFPSAEVKVLEESRHYPHLDDPAAIAVAVVPFLKDQFSRQERATERKSAP